LALTSGVRDIRSITVPDRRACCASAIALTIILARTIKSVFIIGGEMFRALR
jgi:hypothetical protein